MPLKGVLHKVAVKTEPASGSVIVAQAVTVESCFVKIDIGATVGELGRRLTVIGIVILIHLLVLSQTVIQTESAPAKRVAGAY